MEIIYRVFIYRKRKVAHKYAVDDFKIIMFIKMSWKLISCGDSIDV